MLLASVFRAISPQMSRIPRITGSDATLRRGPRRLRIIRPRLSSRPPAQSKAIAAENVVPAGTSRTSTLATFDRRVALSERP
jgi:hypothetical protein